MEEQRNEADDVNNNPETSDAEDATAAATTPVRRQNDQRRRNSSDAATACGDLLESRDPTAELQPGDVGQAVSDSAASKSQPTNKPEASADDTHLSARERMREENARMHEEQERQETQRHLNAIRRAELVERRAMMNCDIPYGRTLQVRARFLDDETRRIDRWERALAQTRTERTERRAKEREERLREAERKRDERQAHGTADTSAVHNTADRSVTEEQSTREIAVGNTEADDTSSTVKDNAQEEAQKSTSTPPHSEQQQTRSAGEGASNSEIIHEQHTTIIGPRNARIRINAPTSLRYAVT